MDNNLSNPKKNSSVGIIVAIFFVFSIIGNFLDDLGDGGEVIIIFLVFIIAILSIFWKLKKVGFGSGIKKDNQGFLNIVKSIIEEEKKKQENKFYNKKSTIDQIKQQDFDILKNEDILEDENDMENSFVEGEKNDQNLGFFINNFEGTEKNKNIKLVSESDKIKMIIIPIAIILIFTLVTIFSSVGDGDIKIDLNKTFIGYGNPNIVWTIVFVLLVFVIGFSIYNYRKKPIKK